VVWPWSVNNPVSIWIGLDSSYIITEKESTKKRIFGFCEDFSMFMTFGVHGARNFRYDMWLTRSKDGGENGKI